LDKTGSDKTLIGIGWYRHYPRHFLLILGNRHRLARTLDERDDF
jgi:hypothetical protein